MDLDTRHFLEYHEQTRLSVASLCFHRWECKLAAAARAGLEFVDYYSFITFRVDMSNFYNFVEADLRLY